MYTSRSYGKRRGGKETSKSYVLVNLNSVSILFYSRHVVFLDQIALATCDTENKVVERRAPKYVDVVTYICIVKMLTLVCFLSKLFFLVCLISDSRLRSSWNKELCGIRS